MGNISEYLEDIIIQCGGFGRFQILLTIIILGAKTSVSWTAIMMVFAGATPDWRCLQNISKNNHFNATTGFKSCYTENGIQCQNFTFDNSMYTIVNQFELVCDKSWIIACATSVQMFGILIASVIMGQVADLIGRKPVLFIALFILCIFNFSCAFSVSWEMFVVLRFLLGIGAGAYQTVHFSLLTEFTLSSTRPVLSAFPANGISTAVLCLLAYLTQNWIELHIATSIITTPFLFTWWLVPESFRWLVSNNRLHKAEDVIKRMAKMNRSKSFDFSIIGNLSLPKDGHKKYTLLDIFRSRHLIRNTLLQALMWFTCYYVSSAMTFGVRSLSGSMYLNVFILSILSVSGDIITIWTSNSFGRKWTLCGFFLVAGVAATCVGVLQTTQIGGGVLGQLINTFAFISKVCCSAASCALVVLCSEVYPTVVRNIGFGIQHTAAFVGAMTAPQIVYLEETYTGILYYLSGGFLLVSSVCALLSPDTKAEILGDLI